MRNINAKLFNDITPISNSVRNINNSMGISAAELLTYKNDRGEAEIPLKRIIGNLKLGIDREYNEILEDIINYNILARRYFDDSTKTDEILKAVVYALKALQTNKTYYTSDEDPRNGFVSAQVTAKLGEKGYICADQQTGGLGASGKAPGERDFVVKDEIGQEILIYEGLNLSWLNKVRIDGHINKLLVNYNPQGLRYSILVTYLECERDKFKIFTDKYREHIAEYAPNYYSCIGKPNDIRFENEFLRCMKMVYEAGESYFTIYHIIVRMGQ